MVRLAAADLETVDTLITAGLADSQAEAIRWALTRIRKLPAYERLRKRAAKSKGLAEKQANAEYAELLGKLETYLAGQAWDVRLSTRLTSRARP
jgi:Arc/MetJ-type ribon-helix-helix transcriptional regulator